MCRCTFHGTCSKFDVDVIIRKNRHHLVIRRIDDLFADQMCITWIFWMNKDTNIPKHRFRTRGADCDLLITPDNRIIKGIKCTFDFLMDNLNVTQCRLRFWIPVDDAFALINQAIFIKIDENLINRLIQALI